jgi:hypothetical protein
MEPADPEPPVRDDTDASPDHTALALAAIGVLLAGIGFALYAAGAPNFLVDVFAGFGGLSLALGFAWARIRV